MKTHPEITPGSLWAPSCDDFFDHSIFIIKYMDKPDMSAGSIYFSYLHLRTKHAPYIGDCYLHKAAIEQFLKSWTKLE